MNARQLTNGLPLEEWAMADKLLTIREAAYLLGLSEKEVIELAEKGEIPAYKVAGVYLRFQKDQIERYKQKAPDIKAPVKAEASFGQQVLDFFYFYDFYIISVIIIVVLLMIISKA